MPSVKWVIDPDHSEIIFKVRYLELTNITGFFRRFSLEVQTADDDFSSIFHIAFTADVNAIDTKDTQRNAFVQSAEMMDAADYSLIHFETAQFDKRENNGLLEGILTIKATRKNIAVQLVYEGTVVDDDKKTRAGFTVHGKISRKNFGLTWNKLTAQGRVILGDEVEFEASIQLLKNS